MSTAGSENLKNNNGKDKKQNKTIMDVFSSTNVCHLQLLTKIVPIKQDCSAVFLSKRGGSLTQAEKL
jgi:hypothetical protein